MELKDVCVGDKVVIRSCGGAGQETIKHSTVVKVRPKNRNLIILIRI